MVQTAVTHFVTHNENGLHAISHAKTVNRCGSTGGGRGTRTPKRSPAPHFEGRAQKDTTTRHSPKAPADNNIAGCVPDTTARQNPPQPVSAVTQTVTHASIPTASPDREAA